MAVKATSTKPWPSQQEKYEAAQAMLALQPPLIQRFLVSQAQAVADSVVQKLQQVKFVLPDRVVVPEEKTLQLPKELREQIAGGLMDRITRTDLRMAIRQRLLELEQDANDAVAAGAALLRHTIVMYMVHDMLPAGRSVTYEAADEEEIPTIPVSGEMEPESAITAQTDAIVEESGQETGRGELLVPYVPYARRFYLPQWVAFDENGDLLVSSISQAEAHVASMQRFLWILHSAVSLATYMVADPEYQRKRYGMLGQLVNQGRALALYETKEIIQTIKRRASAQDLNRGLSLSLPYFDDQDLELKMYPFEVIPAGRIMFIPAFVVVAAKEEQVKVAQDTRLSRSTRKHLIKELYLLERSFETRKR